MVREPADTDSSVNRQRSNTPAQLQEGWVIANHILVSFHVAFISSVLALPAVEILKGEVLRFIFLSWETLVSALFVYVTFHTCIAIHELGHFLTAARLNALNEKAMEEAEHRLGGSGLGKAAYLVELFLKIPYGAALGVKREGLNYYPDSPFNLAVSAAGPRASLRLTVLALPPAILLLATGLTMDVSPAIYAGRLLLGIGLVGFLDFRMADPGKYAAFRERERAAREHADAVEKTTGWLDKAKELKAQMISSRLQTVVHRSLGPVTAPWQFRNCGMGGRHTEKEYPESNISMQEAMFLILRARDYQDAQEVTVRLQTRLKEIIEKEEGCRVMGIGLEGGLAPYIEKGDYPLPEVRLWAMMRQAIEEVGCRPGIDIAIALDPAMSELEIAYRREFEMQDAVGMYLFWRDKAQTVLDREGVLKIYQTAMRDYEIPILSIEDGFSEFDHEGWKLALDQLGKDVFIIGDDLVTTNDHTIEICADKGLMNCALIKANQIGTLYETLLAMLVALGKGQELVVSHRSKSPNDDMEAQIALAVNSLGLKAGGGANTERLVKYQSVTERMLQVATDEGVSGALRAGGRATVRAIRAYEESTNAGIPTVGATLELGIDGAGMAVTFRGATPLGTSAGSGEAIHLIDSMIEQAEHPEVIQRHADLFEEQEPGVYRFRKDVRAAKVRETRDEALNELYDRALRYGGKGCLNAVDNVTRIIAPLFEGRGAESLTLKAADRALLALEVQVAVRRGKLTDDDDDESIVVAMQRKQNLGMNAILSVSLSLARAIAHVQGKELYELLREELLTIIQGLAAANDVQVQGNRFEDYVATLREVNLLLEERGEPLYAALREQTGIYLNEEPELPERMEATAELAAAPPRAPAAVAAAGPEIAQAAPAPGPGKDLLSPPLRLTDDEEESLFALDQKFLSVFADPESEDDVQETLAAFLQIKEDISARVGYFGIANNRIYRCDGRLLVPYLARNTLVLHAVREGRTEVLASRRVKPGTILTDGFISRITGHGGEPVDLEALLLDMDADAVGEVALGRIRDMSDLLRRVNGSMNRNTAIYLLRILVARLCNLPMKAFLGAKNLQPEIHTLTAELARFLNGPYRREFRGVARVLVRNLSTVVGRPNLIDRLWNDTIDLAEVHVRGSAIVNELRRSSHHALGSRTLALAEAYETYLDTGETEALAAQGFARPGEADVHAREKGEIGAIVARVVADIGQLLGTSETVSRIREWQAAFAESLLRCEFGNPVEEELETVITQGIREGNRWGYAHHLRILQRKAAEFEHPAGTAGIFRNRLEGIRGFEPGAPGFDAEQVERAARDAVTEFVAGIQGYYQTELFRSLDELLATNERGEHYLTFLLTRRLRQRVDGMIRHGGYTELRYFLLQLDCLLEEMGYLALRHIDTDYHEHNVQLDRCFQIISRCVLNLELDGIPTRELQDAAELLTDPRRTDAELLNTLLHIEKHYHKIRRRVSRPYERMAGRLNLDPEELRIVLANMHRYMHDLNSMVSFADVARSHIRARSPEVHPGRVETPMLAPENLEPFRIIHLSHRDEVRRAVDQQDGTHPLLDLYGGKGSGLVYISHLGVPTRDGFILPTHLPRANVHREDPQRFEREIREHLEILERDLARRSGVAKRFNDPDNPLLVAVRGGSVYSMPGMLATVVFAGMNDEIATAMARDDAWRAYDSYRRFLASYAAAVWSLNLENANLVDAAKERHGVEYKQDLPWEAMKEIAEASKDAIREEGHSDELEKILADPVEQVFGAVRAVFDSWDSSYVARFREIKGLSWSWHTAAIVQEMALGNGVNSLVEPGMDETGASLTGVVVRTEHTEGGTRDLKGEIKFSAAGDDLVAGVTASSSMQVIGDLKRIMPTLHRRLDHVVAGLRRFMGSDQEVEFTVERGVLSVLQSRSAQTGTDQAPDRFLDPGQPLTRGLGIRGGSFRGLVAFDDADLAEFGQLDLSERDDVDGVVIIVENPTPEEIPMILSADALITAKGGSTSHAAVAIHGIDSRSIFAVMSVEGLQVDLPNRRALVVNDAEEVLGTIGKGDVISLHGTSGAVYLGSREVDRKV